MQKEFNKLSISKQRKFIVKNLLKDEYFKQFHTKFSNIFIEEIYSKNHQKELIKIRNCKINNKITKILQKYKDSIMDYYFDTTNINFYNNAIKQKNKLEQILDNNVLMYKDEDEFRVFELIIDTYNDTKYIESKQASLKSIIEYLKKIFFLDNIDNL